MLLLLSSTKCSTRLFFPIAESSQAARHGGCFPPDATIVTEGGATKKLSELSVGERVQSVDAEGRLVFSPVLLFLDRDVTEPRDFVRLESANGAAITLTASHLIYTVSSQDLLEDVDLGTNAVDGSDEDLLDELMINATMDRLGSRLRATFASNVQIGDWIVTREVDGRLTPQKVVAVGVESRHGVLAPLTEQGTLVIDGVLVSCYAVIDDQAIAHLAFAPIRLANNVRQSLVHFWRSIRWWNHERTNEVSRSGVPVAPATPTTPRAAGIHWYAAILYRIARFALPSHLVFN